MKKGKVAGVLVIYTGGTVGMVRKDPNNPFSPLVPGTWEMLKRRFPQLKQFTFPVHGFQWKQPIDSSNIRPQDWIDIAEVIANNYGEYQGFVILHGTDTMTYTTSALSFLLENLTKPVIVTGSQLPIAELRSDAVQNLVTSIMIAAPVKTGIPVIPEVCLFFGDKLYRGNRVRKISSSGYFGFDSSNYPVLGEAGEKIQINEQAIKKMASNYSDENLRVHRVVDPHVASLEIFPGIQPDILKAIFNISSLKGIVLKTYGAGNTPTDRAFLDAIEYGTKKGKIIVNVTQCYKGAVEIGLYETSIGLLDRGVISGLDMTPEAALTKMCVLFGQDLAADEVRTLMQANLRGEQSTNIYSIDLSGGKASPIFRSLPIQLPNGIEKEKITRATVRIQGLSLPGCSKGRIDLHLSLSHTKASLYNPSSNDPHLINGHQSVYWKRGKESTLTFDTTDYTQRILDTDYNIRITIVSPNKVVNWKRITFSIHQNV